MHLCLDHAVALGQMEREQSFHLCHRNGPSRLSLSPQARRGLSTRLLATQTANDLQLNEALQRKPHHPCSQVPQLYPLELVYALPATTSGSSATISPSEISSSWATKKEWDPGSYARNESQPAHLHCHGQWLKRLSQTRQINQIRLKVIIRLTHMFHRKR